MIVVSNASPIIALARVDCLHLLGEIFGELNVSRQVFKEIAKQGTRRPGARAMKEAAWIHQKGVSLDEIRASRERTTGLSDADLSVLCLAHDLKADLVLVDERRLRKIAKQDKLHVVGTGGILVRAKQAGLIKAVKPLMDNLVRNHEFRMTRQAYRDILLAAGE
ncbi:MAG: DUF3368 domain-containing protein [Pseudomonadota bacterium]